MEGERKEDILEVVKMEGAKEKEHKLRGRKITQ